MPGLKDKCPVCGMFVAKYPEWVAVIIFRDGSRAYFDGPKDLFRYYFDLPKYKKNGKMDDISEMYVTDYYTTKLVLARDAYFVLGSDVLGPMGHELIPIQGKKEAEAFAKDHRGIKVLRLDQITPSELSKIP